MVIGAIVGIWIARYLGPADFGLWSYATAFVSIFSGLAGLGLDGVVIKGLVSEPYKHGSLLGTSFWMKVIGSTVMLPVIMSAIIILKPTDDVAHILVLLIAIGAVFNAFDVIDFWFQANVQSKFTVYAKNLAFLLASLVKMLFILFSAPLVYFAIASILEAIVGAIGLLFVYRMRGRSLSFWAPNFALAKHLIGQSWPLIFSGTFVLVNMSIDKLMLGNLVSNSEAGIYSAAARISEVWYFIPIFIGASMMPSLVESKNKDDVEYYSTLQKIYNFMTMASLSLALTVSGYSEWLIDFIYGEHYRRAAAMLAVHVWTGVFVFHVSIRTKSLIIEGNQKFIAVVSFFTMFFNVFLNYLLIPEYGGLGASYSSLVAWALCAIAVPFLSKDASRSVRMFVRSFCFWKFRACWSKI